MGEGLFISCWSKMREAHAELVRRAFGKASLADRYRLVTVGSLEEAQVYQAAVTPDLVIAGFVPARWSRDRAFARPGCGTKLPRGDYDRPGNEQVAVEAIKAGALDYVVKSPVTLPICRTLQSVRFASGNTSRSASGWNKTLSAACARRWSFIV